MSDSAERRVSVIGRLGVYPMLRLPVPGRRLLAYLALHPDPVPRGLAAGELWPDQPEHQARANLRRALWHLTRDWVDSRGDELVLDATVDLPRARALASRALTGCSLDLDEIDLLSVGILPGWHEEWVTNHQAVYDLLRVQALESACRFMTAEGRCDLAIQAGTVALAVEPLRESAADALIDAHLTQGNRYEAVRLYRDLSVLLRRELGVEPGPSTRSRLDGILRPRGA